MDAGRRHPVAIVDRQRQAAARHRTGNEANGRRHSRKDGQAGPSEQPSGRNVRRLGAARRKNPLFRFANQGGTGRALLGCLSRAGRIRSAPVGPRGGVVTQRSAKPCTPVQFWSWPPLQPTETAEKSVALGLAGQGSLPTCQRAGPGVLSASLKLLVFTRSTRRGRTRRQRILLLSRLERRCESSKDSADAS